MRTSHTSIFFTFIAVGLATTISMVNGERVATNILSIDVENIAGANFTEEGDYDYVQVLYIHNDTLLVGNKGGVKMFDLPQLNPQIDCNITCIPVSPGGGALDCATVRGPDGLCDTYVNVIEEYNGFWYICGTSGINPQCWKYDCDANWNCTNIIDGSFPAAGLVTSKPGTDQPFLITDVDGVDKVFGAAATQPNFDNQHAIVRVDLEDFTSNRLETETDNDEMMTDDGTDFIGDPIEFGGHVYFFFLEHAKEYEAIDKIKYSRVARVCKNDRGGVDGSNLMDEFTTFLKARLNCSVAGEYSFNYDYLQDIYQSPRDSNIIYALFTDTPIKGSANSAICVYDIREIADVFDKSKFRGQEGVTSLWLPPLERFVPSTRPGGCDVSLPKNDYTFIKDYPLMDRLVPNIQAYRDSNRNRSLAFDRDSDLPLMLLDRLYITQLVVDENAAGTEYDVFLLGSYDGKVYKAYNHGYGTEASQTRIFEEIKLNLLSESEKTGKTILTMMLYNDKLFVGSTIRLDSIPIAGCDVYEDYGDRNSSCSPYCSENVDDCGASSGETPSIQQPGPDVILPNILTACTATTEINLTVGGSDLEFFNPQTDEAQEPQATLNQTCQACCEAGNCSLSSTPSCDPRDCCVRLASNGTYSTVLLLNVFARAPDGSQWEETEFACDCASGCPQIQYNETLDDETTARSSNLPTNNEYLLGRYYFDLTECSGTVNINSTFRANGTSLMGSITVVEDSSARITDNCTLAEVKSTDEEISHDEYKVAWETRNKNSWQPGDPDNVLYCCADCKCPTPDNSNECSPP